MRITQLAAIALATGLSSASPVQKRQAIDDVGILNYALTLEFLERKFYEEGLANYTQQNFIDAGFADPFYKNLQEVAQDEMDHVDFISTAITAAGGKPVHEAMYSFPATTPKEFVTLSSVLEGVGVSAYLGAAAKIMSKDYLTAAGSILTIEARHTSYVRAALGESPFPAPFDTPLDFMEVFSLAAPFITGFAPEDPALPFKAFPKLAIKMGAPDAKNVAGTTSVTFMDACGYKAKDGGQVYAAFFSGLKPAIVPVTVAGNDYTAPIPAGVAGQVYVVLTSSPDKPSDENILAGPAIAEVYEPGKVPTS